MFPFQSTQSIRPKKHVESYRIYIVHILQDHPLRVTEKATHGKLVGPTLSCLQKGTSITINEGQPLRPQQGRRDSLGLLCMVFVYRKHLYASHQLLLCSNSPQFNNITGKLTQFFQNGDFEFGVVT